MRILADENFPKAMVNLLRKESHNVCWVLTDMPRSTDSEILNRAEDDSRIILTLDKDFWQIALQRRIPLTKAGVVWIRIHPATPEKIEPLVRAFIEASKEWTGHISVVTADIIQMVPSKQGLALVLQSQIRIKPN